MPKVNGLTLKQRRFRKELIKTLSPTEAAMKVYDCKDKHSAAQIAYENLKKLDISLIELMEKMGLTDEEDTKDLMRLRKAVYVNKNGLEVADSTIQLKALELTYKLKGQLKDKHEVEHKGELVKLINIVTTGQIEDKLGERLRKITDNAEALPGTLLEV